MSKLLLNPLNLCFVALTIASLAGCASVARQPWDRPVVVSKLGKEMPASIADACIAKAKDAGLFPLDAGSTEKRVLRNQAYRNHVGNCILAQDYVILGWN